MASNDDQKKIAPMRAAAPSGALRFPVMSMLRSATESVVEQMRRAKTGLTGVTFGGKRDLYETCGYDRHLRLMQYRERYARGDIASRVVEAFPEATWRGSGHDCVFDSDDAQETTPFEKAWNDLNKRLKVWSVFYRADVLAGLGHYAIILLGAPGDYNSPLPDTLKPTDLLFLSPFCQEDSPITEYVTDIRDPRYGQPLFYQLRRTSVLRKSLEQARAPMSLDLTKQVHYSRVLHIADGKLDDDVFGLPRLERVWNRLDDLDKVVGAGAEAFWLRAHQGMQFDVDPEIELEADEAARMKSEIEDYIHRLSRVIRTRGVTATPFGSDVARFDENIAGIISLISGTTKIPQRILLGSERGELASTQDRDTWRERVQDRRTRFAEPELVRPFVERLIERNCLPKPQQEAKIGTKAPGPGGRPVAGVVPGADVAKSKSFAFGDAKPAAARAAAIRPIAQQSYMPSDTDTLQRSRGDDPTGTAGITVVQGEVVDERNESPNFKVYWDEVLDTPQLERVEIAVQAKTLGATVITDAEIRDTYLGLEPMSEEDLAAAAAVQEADHMREIEKVKARGPSPFGAEPGAPGKPSVPAPGVGMPDGTNGKAARPSPFGRSAAETDNEHSGLFVYLKLDPASAKELALKGEGAEDPSTLHITVAYCDGDFATAVPFIRSVAEKSPALSGYITGIGTFAPSLASDGKTVLWAYPDVEGLDELHDAVVSALDTVRIGERTSREYRPHITLAYIDADAEMALPLIERVNLYFWQLCVRKGEDVEEFPLGGNGFGSVSPATPSGY